jgi:hypothetical protein
VAFSRRAWPSTSPDSADAEKLIHLVLGRGVLERALRGAEVDPAVGLQALQGFTHRLPADAEVLGQFVFDQVLAPLQGALHDQVHDRVVDGLDAEGAGRCTRRAAPSASV